MLPPPEEALVHSPTWVRGSKPAFSDAVPVTLVMALEEEPATEHASMVADHIEALSGLVAIGEVVLGITSPDAPERKAIGFALLMFAAELASVLYSPQLSPELTGEVRSVAAETIAAATLRSGGCLAAVVSEHLVSLA
jgi:hypothetical protein